MSDPFDLTQYSATFNKNSDYTPDLFAFADFTKAFAMISNSIQMRQAAVHRSFDVPTDDFINVSSYDLSTPSSMSDAVQLFQDAIRQIVQGSTIDTYGKHTDCDLYVGFFHFKSNGLPIVGISAIMPDGDFTDPPNPEDVEDILEFAIAIGERLNELILALNSLDFFHGPMYSTYPFEDDCVPESSSDGTESSSSGTGSSSSGTESSSSGTESSSSGTGSSSSGTGSSSEGTESSSSGTESSSSGTGSSSSGTESSSEGTEISSSGTPDSAGSSSEGTPDTANSSSEGTPDSGGTSGSSEGTGTGAID